MHCCAYLYLNCGCFLAFFPFPGPVAFFCASVIPLLLKIPGCRPCVMWGDASMHVARDSNQMDKSRYVNNFQLQFSLILEYRNWTLKFPLCNWSVKCSIKRPAKANSCNPWSEAATGAKMKWSSHKWSVWSANLCRKLWFSQDLARRYAASFVVDVSECHRVSDDRTSSHLTREQRKFL